jgi:hypothetical protein
LSTPQEPTTLIEALRSVAQREETQLRKLIDERRQLVGWCTLPIPDPLRGYLHERQSELDLEIAALVARWCDAGGGVTLVADAGEMAATPAPAPLRKRPPPMRHDTLDLTDELADGPTEEIAPYLQGLRPRPPVPRSSRTSLRRLKQEAPLARPRRNVVWQPEYYERMAQLGLGRTREAERSRLLEAAVTCETWIDYPAEVQRRLIGLITCRLRAVQQAGPMDDEVESAFRSLTAFSARERPGFVHGLMRTHKPRSGNWSDDADVHWEWLSALLPDESEPAPNEERLLAEVVRLAPEIELAPEVARDAVRSQVLRAIRAALDGGVDSRNPRLVKLANPLVDHLDGVAFRRLRRAIRDAVPTEESDDDPVEGLIPEDWRWWERTRDRQVVMVGGSPRPKARERLETAFEIADLQWFAAENRKSSLTTIRERVKAGKVDLVIILGRFVGHDADDVILPTCRETDTPWVHVDHGYGVSRVRRAIERFLEPSAVE